MPTGQASTGRSRIGDAGGRYLVGIWYGVETAPGVMSSHCSVYIRTVATRTAFAGWVVAPVGDDGRWMMPMPTGVSLLCLLC